MITEKEITEILKKCSNKAIYGVQVVDGELYISQNNYEHIAKTIIDKIEEKELLEASKDKTEKDTKEIKRILLL